jgi:hypothetical protein
VGFREYVPRAAPLRARAGGGLERVGGEPGGGAGGRRAKPSAGEEEKNWTSQRR